MSSGSELHNEPNADRKSGMMIEEVVRNAIVALSEEENKNFREKRKVVNKINPRERYGYVAVRGSVEWLTSEMFRVTSKLSSVCLRLTGR